VASKGTATSVGHPPKWEAADGGFSIEDEKVTSLPPSRNEVVMPVKYCSFQKEGADGARVYTPPAPNDPVEYAKKGSMFLVQLPGVGPKAGVTLSAQDDIAADISRHDDDVMMTPSTTHTIMMARGGGGAGRRGGGGAPLPTGEAEV